jgi:hypothetical protein
MTLRDFMFSGTDFLKRYPWTVFLPLLGWLSIDGCLFLFRTIVFAGIGAVVIIGAYVWLMLRLQKRRIPPWEK